MKENKQEIKRMELLYKGWEESSANRKSTIIMMRRDCSHTPEYKQWEYCMITEDGEVRSGVKLRIKV